MSCRYTHWNDGMRDNSHRCGARMSFDSMDSTNPREVNCPRCIKILVKANLRPTPSSRRPDPSKE